MTYPVVIHKDSDSDFGVTVPDLPGCFSAGSTLNDALTNAGEAIATHVEGLLLDGEPIPEPRRIELHLENGNYEDAIWAVVTVDFARVAGRARRINITIPERVLSRVDAYAKRTGDSRSGLIAAAALEYITRRRDELVT